MILAGNILNIVASVIQILSVLFKSKIKVLFGVVAASTLYVTAYIMIGIYPDAILSLVGLAAPIVNYIFARMNKEKPWWVYVCFLVYISTVTAVTIACASQFKISTPYFILFPALAMTCLVCSTIPKKQLPFRLLLAALSTLWLIYGIIINQFGIIIGNAIQLLFLAIQVVYYYITERRERKTDNTEELKENDSNECV